ncbi:MAG: cyclic nucleotide-binding domain-containing protein [Saprospiraceae bacterium]|nr:cyclic nucleotide-binding domain-containing protein [Saprospiraceae bacterium]
MESWPSYLLFASAFGLSVAAFSSSSIIVLRTLTIISSICYAFYYFIFPADPLWLDIMTECILIIINGVMLIYLYARHQKISFNKEEKEIYQAIFSSLTPFQFFKLIKSAKWVNFAKNIKLLSKDSVVESIYFIYNGKAKVVLGPHREVELSDGYFIGERSFSLGQRANADVITTQPSKMLRWSQEELKDLFSRNPQLERSFKNVISQDMAKKLNL